MLVDTQDPAYPDGPQDPDRGRPRRADPADHDRDVPELLLDDPESVQQRREDDDRGPVLVVVEDRDVERLPQALLDREAAGRRDVLQVDPAVDRRDVPDRLDDLVHVLRGEAHRKGVDVGELLEQERLPFHHRQGRLRTDVAQTEDRRPVGHDGHRVLLDGQGERPLGVLPDGQADARHARCVGHGQVVPRLERHLVPDRDLAAKVRQERPVGYVDDPHALDAPDGAHDVVPVGLVARVDREVADDDVLDQLDEIHGPDVAPGLADGGRHQAEHARAVLDRRPDGQAVRGTRRDGHGTSQTGRISPRTTTGGSSGWRPRSAGTVRSYSSWTRTRSWRAKTTRSSRSVPTYTAASRTSNSTPIGYGVSSKYVRPLSLRRRRVTWYRPGAARARTGFGRRRP